MQEESSSVVLLNEIQLKLNVFKKKIEESSISNELDSLCNEIRMLGKELKFNQKDQHGKYIYGKMIGDFLDENKDYLDVYRDEDKITYLNSITDRLLETVQKVQNEFIEIYDDVTAIPLITELNKENIEELKKYKYNINIENIPIDREIDEKRDVRQSKILNQRENHLLQNWINRLELGQGDAKLITLLEDIKNVNLNQIYDRFFFCLTRDINEQISFGRYEQDRGYVNYLKRELEQAKKTIFPKSLFSNLGTECQKIMEKLTSEEVEPEIFELDSFRKILNVFRDSFIEHKTPENNKVRYKKIIDGFFNKYVEALTQSMQWAFKEEVKKVNNNSSFTFIPFDPKNGAIYFNSLMIQSVENYTMNASDKDEFHWWGSDVKNEQFENKFSSLKDKEYFKDCYNNLKSSIFLTKEDWDLYEDKFLAHVQKAKNCNLDVRKTCIYVFQKFQEDIIVSKTAPRSMVLTGAGCQFAGTQKSIQQIADAVTENKYDFFHKALLDVETAVGLLGLPLNERSFSPIFSVNFLKERIKSIGGYLSCDVRPIWQILLPVQYIGEKLKTNQNEKLGKIGQILSVKATEYREAYRQVPEDFKKKLRQELTNQKELNNITEENNEVKKETEELNISNAFSRPNIIESKQKQPVKAEQQNNYSALDLQSAMTQQEIKEPIHNPKPVKIKIRKVKNLETKPKKEFILPTKQDIVSKENKIIDGEFKQLEGNSFETYQEGTKEREVLQSKNPYGVKNKFKIKTIHQQKIK